MDKYISPVGAVVGARVMSTHNHKDVLKVRADVFGGERKRPGLLEHNRDDIVPNVPFPQQLVKQKRQQEKHTELY